MGRGWWAGVAIALVGAAGCSSELSEGSVADRLAEAFAADDGGGLDEEQADCLGRDLVALVGIDEFREEGASADEIAALGLDDVGLDGSGDAEDLADLLDDCDVELDDPDLDDLDGLAGDVVVASLREPYVDAVAETLAPALGFIGDTEERCVAELVVDAVGIADVAELGEPDDVAEAFALTDLGLDFDADHARDVAGGLEDCDLDLDFAFEITMESVRLTSFDEAVCVRSGLDDDELRHFVYASLISQGDELFDDDLTDRIDELLDGCSGPDLEEYFDEFLEALLDDPGHPLPESDAGCVADLWVFGTDPEVLAVIEPADLGELDDLPLVGLPEDLVFGLVDAVGSCGLPLDFALALVDTVPLAVEQVACVAGLVPQPGTALSFIEDLLLDELAPGTAASLVLDAINQCGIAG